MAKSDAYQRIYAAVRRIPRGKVATYGQIAELAGLEGHARQAGYALHAAPPGLPWHRVINSQGRISARAGSDWGELQRLLLEAEGVEFDSDGGVDLTRFRWKVRGSRSKGKGNK
ncbi:MAG TPA: MGMT family protein [Thermoanaerobaculia bacterium]|nr:MGMT family protein [Thermoanaerobaculia bacterium]